MELSRYALEPLRQDEEFILYRGRSKQAEAPSLLLLVPASSRPAPETLKKIEHEYSFRNELDATWAVRPATISQYNEQRVLVLEDPGGEPLNRHIDGPTEMRRFLRFAIGLATALRRLHEQQLIHKDLKPSNIIVDSATGQIWLTGFGIASRLMRERQSPEPPEFIAGTLAYMAPEQTGRMNRSVDSRSDLYALGITFYEMLTGSLPFTASDPMEWVHCHIARQPVPPSERVKNVPGSVSAIVMKLLAKTAEDRYQTASGAESDLRRCLAEWETQGRISEFPPGQHDTPDRLLIPEKLYGRAREVETLLTAFDRVVATGRPELVLVSGYSGVGKSAVVSELHEPLVPLRGLFASGKFDQYKRDIPYATLAQAFQSLIRPLLGKSEADLAEWRNDLRAALEPNGQLIVDLVPELNLIIGEQPPVPEVPPQDAQRRFQLVFRRFISVFARPQHPLALFLDDLQWLDAATLDLLEDLLTQADVQHLLLIGAYRDNEVDPTHPLMRKLQAMRQAGAILQDIVLAPLTGEDLRQLVADALHCEPEPASHLAQLIHDKTAGNPFFAIQFISSLVEEGLLTFDHGGGRWSWDLNRIHAKGYTDNVVDLLVGKLDRLPMEAQKALQQLACLGNSAGFVMLQMVSQNSDEEMRAQLWEAVRTGLVVRAEDSYRFLHDRVQEAAYSLIPEELRAETHLRIGRLLAAQTPPDNRDERIFEIVNQLNRGTDLITSKAERERVAELNLAAGRRAKISTAYASALAYLRTGRGLLSDQTWFERYDLIFSIECLLAECELLTANMAAAEVRLSMLAQRAKSNHDIAAVTRLRLTLYTTLDLGDRAIEVCLDYLRRSGTDWSAHPTNDDVRREYDRVWSLVGNRQIEEFVDLPLMTIPDVLDTLDVLTEIVTPALSCDENLCSLVICHMVNLSLEHGNSDASCFAYVWFAIIAGPRFGNYKDGFRFGQLGYELVDKRGLKRYEARTYMSFGHIVMPWGRHVRSSRFLIRRAFDVANRIGDLTFATYCCDMLNANFLSVGDPLVDVLPEAEEGLAFARNVRFGFVIDLIRVQVALIRNLLGLTQKFGSFNDEDFDELEYERHLGTKPVLALPECWYFGRKTQARFLAGDHASAVDASLRAQRLAWTSPSQFEVVEFLYYGALAHAACWDSASPEQKQRHLEALTTHHKKFETWAKVCPENFENRAALLSAEIARIEGREFQAMRLYKQAIRSAHANGFVHNEAVAYEIAARFYATHGFDKIADAYLREARYGYLRWGATGKVRQLEELYPYLREERPVTAAMSTIGTPLEQLDLATVIKISQAVSGEMVHQKLINTLVRTAIEHAGATRGLLILPRGGNLGIEAEAVTSDANLIGRGSEAAESAMPESIVHFVARTQECVILDDAAADQSFSADTYIRQHHARSVLCLPLINQSNLIGVLYLENNLTPRVFTPTRVVVLKLLASQAAISLENTRLYSSLEEREAKIRRLVDANIMGIFIWNFHGKIVEANEAFLHMVQCNRQDLALGHLHWTDLTPLAWRERDHHALADLKTLGSTQPYEKEFLRRDGSRVPVLVGGALFEAGGNEGVAFVLDLTEQKRAEEALRRSESYLAQAQRLAHIGSWVWQVAGRKAVYLSEEWYRVYGFDPRGDMPNWEERLQRVHPEDRAMWQAAIDRAIDEKSDYDLEFRILPPGTAVRYVHSVGRPVLDASGELVQYIGIAMDVSEHHRAEEERETLRQAQADLAHINRVSSMGELTASLAHEIKQPISAALTDAKTCLRWLSRDQPDVTEAQEAASRLIKDVSRATDIISRIGLLFKKDVPQRESIDVNEVIHEMIALLRSEAARHSISIHDDLASNLPRVMADRVQLQQVFMNLMLNGIEAIKDVCTPGKLTIRSQQGENRQVLVSVIDTGVGLQPEHAGQIFKAFFTSKAQGTGMGLPISRSIIESHGGRLWAAANSGPGATFQFTLPIEDTAHQAA